MYVPIGVLATCAAVPLGGTLGVLLSRWIPERIRNNLMPIFGLSALLIGLVNALKLSQMPAVVLSLILGLIIGELLQLEKLFHKGAVRLAAGMSRLSMGPSEGGEKMQEDFVSILVIFCFSGTGIFGALQSGLNGDHTVLLTKAIMDLFTAVIFAITLGHMVSVVCLPEVVILLTLFFSAGLLMPLVSESMLGDFMACGGLLSIATGFRVAGIKNFPVGNMLPALVLVMPLSALWSSVIQPLLG